VRALTLSILSLFLGLFALCAPAHADAFTVRGVLVDETAETQVIARRNAIGAGQLLAARQLIDRLTLPEDRFAAPPLDAARAAGFTAMQFNAVVSANTAAIALWRDLGFVIVGTVPGAFRHPKLGAVDLHVMHRAL